MSRDDVIVAAAREWIGTPYRHQASCRGAGTDCLGLVRGVWREVFGAEPERAPAYTPDWGEVAGDERLLAAAARHLIPVGGAPHRSDLLVFRMADGAVAKHLGLLTETAPGARFVHAYSGHGVVESALTRPWARRLAGVFRFPEEML